MDDLTEKTEKSLLMKLRLAVWITLFLALIAAVGSIVFAVFQYSQVLEMPKLETRRPAASVSAGDFLKELAPQGNFPSGKIIHVEPSPPDLAAARVKYLDEAKQIVACSKDSNAKSGLDTSAFTPQLAETFQHELQQVADSAQGQRGILYVADAVRFFCEVMSRSEVIAYKKSNSEIQLFDAVINYHLKQWDQLNEKANRFQRDEQLRVLNDTVKGELRVANTNSSIFAAVCISVGSLGLLIVAALYFILVGIESKVQSLHRMVESINLNSMQHPPHSESSKLLLRNLPPEFTVADSNEHGT